MRMGLRADSSESIGAGHAARQLGIAQFLVQHGVEAFFIGNLSGPQWLQALVHGQEGLNVVAVSEADFRPESIEELELDGLLIDSYRVRQVDLDKLKECVQRVGVMVDGPDQQLSGSTAFAPAFDADAEWLAHARGRFSDFHSGPEFFVLRQEVIRQKKSPSRSPLGEKSPKVIISAGGGQSHYEEQILRACLALREPIHFDIFFPPRQSLFNEIEESGHSVQVHRKGATFLELAAQADLTISGAGSVAAELFYLKAPAIFVPVAANQHENARSISRIGGAEVLWPTSQTFGTDLRTAILDIIHGQTAETFPSISIDALGAERISRAMLPLAR